MKASSPPATSLSARQTHQFIVVTYNSYEPTYLPGGKVLMCAKGFHGATYCY